MAYVAYGVSAVRGIRSSLESATRNFAAANMMLVIRVYDEAGNVIQTQRARGRFFVSSMLDPARLLRLKVVAGYLV